ncbi:transposase [Paratractidigestivibacter sp.]|uniref:transposase n=1 Tax=Paratractidigestivibacter sp. TaxID=2847316 RepID=UPI002ABE3BDC|nr:transposase [Paratractidigestivibacter sp.]
MPRVTRAKSESGFYHVIAKGSGGQNLFECDADYQAFLAYLSKNCEKFGVLVRAYCLMSNHIHLLLEDHEGCLSEVMKATITSYALRFNKNNDHIGHVFQQRFKSQPVEDDGYLLQAVRYIHNNPAKAGICPADEYRWSSFREYAAGVIGVADTSLILEMCGSVDGFLAFSAADDSGGYRFAHRSRISETEARELASHILGEIAPASLKTMERRRRDALLFDLKDAGLSMTQIQRLTGIGRWIISEA